MAENNFQNAIPAILHPKLEERGQLMVMDADLGEDRLRFEGRLTVEAPLNPAETKPNGTFYYDDVPNGPVHASYHRDMDGPKQQLVRINFAESPAQDAKQLGYYESFDPIPSLVFISGAQGPGIFMRAPKA